MFKRYFAICLTIIIAASSTMLTINAAERATHVHVFTEKAYLLRIEEEGTYTHSYLYGYDANGNEIRKDCLVNCETEVYRAQCSVSGCSEQYGEIYEYTETHGACGQ